jgi:hypothetical protein
MSAKIDIHVKMPYLPHARFPGTRCSVKEFFRDLFITMPLEMWRTDWQGKLLVIGGIVMVLVFAYYFSRRLFQLVDYAGTPMHFVDATVTSKRHCPSVTLFVPFSTDKAILLRPEAEPEHWEIEVTFDGMEFEVTVPVEMYDAVAEGDTVVIEYRIGRLTGKAALYAFSLNNDIAQCTVVG